MMISVPEARVLVQTQVQRMAAKSCLLQDASGCVLAADVVAPYDVPLWPQSAVDGYAFAFSSWQTSLVVPLSQVVAAGDAANLTLAARSAARHFRSYQTCSSQHQHDVSCWPLEKRGALILFVLGGGKQSASFNSQYSSLLVLGVL